MIEKKISESDGSLNDLFKNTQIYTHTQHKYYYHEYIFFGSSKIL